MTLWRMAIFLGRAAFANRPDCQPTRSLLRLILPYERPPEPLLVFDKGFGLRRGHNRCRRAELREALLHTRRLQRVIKALVQPMHNIRRRSCWSRQTHEPDRTE